MGLLLIFAKNYSGIRSIINCDRNDNRGPSYQLSKMAAAAVAVNSYPYPSEPPSGYEVASTFAGHSPSVHNLISHTDSRWPTQATNDSRQSQSQNWQSLPSIHEALAPKSAYESPLSASLPATREPLFSRSQTPTIPRTYPPSEKTHYATTAATPTIAPITNIKRPPSQPIHQSINFSAPQHESSVEPFSETLAHSSIPTSSSRNSHHSLVEASRFDPEQQTAARPSSGHSQLTATHQAYDITKSAPIPPNNGKKISTVKQRSLPPRELLQESQEARGSTRGGGSGGEEDRPDPALKFRGGLKRNLDVWDFENNLAEVSGSLRILLGLIKYRLISPVLPFKSGQLTIMLSLKINSTL